MTTGSGTVSSRHWSLKEKAQRLRAKGLSYKEIIREIPVSKSTMSLWVRDVRLTRAQERRLWEKRDHTLKGVRAMQTMFWNRRCQAFTRGAERIVSVDQRQRFIAGLMLYWGEGMKRSGGAAIANSDPQIIRCMVRWFGEFFGVRPDEFTIHLHLHSGQDEQKMKQYWSKLTSIPLRSFRKSFVKPEGSGYRKNILYNGTVRLSVRKPGSRYMLFEILGGISAYLREVLGGSVQPERWMSKSPYAE